MKITFSTDNVLYHKKTFVTSYHYYIYISLNAKVISIYLCLFILQEILITILIFTKKIKNCN